MDRLVEPLQLCLATLGEPDAVDPKGEVDDLPAREHLAGARERAEPCRDVQRAAPVAALDRHRLAGVQPDPDGERKGWIGDRLLDEPLLQSHGPTDRRARRTEDDQRLVTAELEHAAPGDPRPPSGSPGRSGPPGAPASSSPRSCVKAVYPRTSAIRNAWTSASRLVSVWDPGPLDGSPTDDDSSSGGITRRVWTQSRSKGKRCRFHSKAISARKRRIAVRRGLPVRTAPG